MKAAASYAAMFVMGLLAVGCATVTPTLHNAAVEVQDTTAGSREWYVVPEVRAGQVARVCASYVWAEGNPGSHDIRWDVYEKGRCIRKGKDQTVVFNSSPVKTWLSLDTTALGVGTFDCVLYMDGIEATRVALKVAPVSADVLQRLGNGVPAGQSSQAPAK